MKNDLSFQDIKGAKKALRKSLTHVFDGFDAAYVDACSSAVCGFLRDWELFKDAGTIMAYLSFGNEVSLDDLIRSAIAEGRTVLVPYIVSGTHFVPARVRSLENLTHDRYGIRTVRDPAEIIAGDEIDLVLVPGLAFAKDGRRLGRGAGYYDRFLADLDAVTCGIGCERLVREDIPVDGFDRKVRYLATENGIIKC